ncbi:hypothetical protein [Methylibium petroleiphilum]|uniref:Uncharacterized protein n=2 Tax=Methylibium TaxID=316612 RepID=A2SLL2_METPP|nr:hypothetical protein [Methylibium petroleiphilum]ABM96451.1 conserved hypothetical protein [Methylibium petroleiphilum PM1]
MFPWFWLHWAPQLHFPLSGAVTQDIFSGIRPTAGDADVERAVFDVASYGKQLGWLSEVVLGQQPDATPERAAQAQTALQCLRTLAVEVETIKDRQRRERREAASAAVEALAQSDPEALAALLARHAVPPAVPAPRRRQPARRRTPPATY